MRPQRRSSSWVVYKTSFQDRHGPVDSLAVCDAEDWAALETAKPGENTLVKGGFASESDADQFARLTVREILRLKEEIKVNSGLPAAKESRKYAGI